jgi:transportin-1
VREASCRTLESLFAVDVGEIFSPHAELVVQKFSMALNAYEHRDSRLLYDAIGAFADGVDRSALRSPHFAEILMPPLIQRWTNLADDDGNYAMLTDVSPFQTTFLIANLIHRLYHRL